MHLQRHDICKASISSSELRSSLHRTKFCAGLPEHATLLDSQPTKKYDNQSLKPVEELPTNQPLKPIEELPTEPSAELKPVDVVAKDSQQTGSLGIVSVPDPVTPQIPETWTDAQPRDLPPTPSAYKQDLNSQAPEPNPATPAATHPEPSEAPEPTGKKTPQSPSYWKLLG